jgi:hypothetical protein
LLLLLLLLLLVVGTWLRHSSERVWRKGVHVDSIMRAVGHICGMFRHGSRGYLGWYVNSHCGFISAAPRPTVMDAR